MKTFQYSRCDLFRLGQFLDREAEPGGEFPAPQIAVDALGQNFGDMADDIGKHLRAFEAPAPPADQRGVNVGPFG